MVTTECSRSPTLKPRNFPRDVVRRQLQYEINRACVQRDSRAVEIRPVVAVRPTVQRVYGKSRVIDHELRMSARMHQAGTSVHACTYSQLTLTLTSQCDLPTVRLSTTDNTKHH